MLTRICLSLALLTATPVWSQLESVPFEMPSTPTDEARMLTPPPVSGVAYPTTVGSQTRSNYLAAGLILNTAYDDNVLAGGSITPVHDVIYSILPTISVNQTTLRQNLLLTYSPGFTIYQHTSALNATNQTAALNFQYHLTEHTTVVLSDFFQKSSNVFSQLYPISGEAISGSTQSQPAEVIAPYADRLANTANVGITYQFARNGMIGASGIAAESNYSDPKEAAGLYNSNSFGGSAFYSRRLSSTQYVGMTYQYLRTEGNPVIAQTNPGNAQTEVQTHTVLPFYTIYFSPALSLSLSGGPQYFDATQFPSLPVHSWTPSAKASMGWQSSHTNFVASYLRTITGSVGLPGAFSSNSANASVNWQIARTWAIASAASYSINKNVTPLFFSSSPGGHTVSGTVSIQHSITEHLKAEIGYARLHQSYNDIAVISNAPDSNREFISISYQLTRPLGR
jgi:hypothetical protein